MPSDHPQQTTDHAPGLPESCITYEEKYKNLSEGCGAFREPDKIALRLLEPAESSKVAEVILSLLQASDGRPK